MKVNYDPEKQFGLNAVYFEGMRGSLNAALIEAMRTMQRKDIGKSSVTLKIEIETTTVCIDDRICTNPDIKYKLTVCMQAKMKGNGKIVDATQQLVCDGTGEFYIVSEEEAEGQISMFDQDQETEEIAQ